MEDVQMDDARTPLMAETNSELDTSLSMTDENVDIDEVLERTGPFGPFQIIIQMVFMYFSISITYQIVLSYFIGHNPPWKCARDNGSGFCAENYGREFSLESHLFYERCNLTRDEWVYTTAKSYSYVTEFDLICTRKSFAAWLSGAVFVGGLIVPVFAGTITDTYGRKLVIIISVAFNLVLSISCSFVENEWQLLWLRIAIGAAAFTSFANGFLLLLEFMAPSRRALSASVFLVAFSMSLFMLDLAAYFVRDWRKLNGYTSIPSIITFFMFFFIPKSPRWLLNKGEVPEATRILRLIGKYNRKPMGLFSLKLPSGSIRKVYTYIDLFRTWKLALATLSLGIIYGAMAFVYYQIALESSNLGGNIYESFALSAVADVPSYFAGIYLCNRFGRKKSVSAALFMSGIAIGCIALIPNSYRSRYTAKIAFAILSKLFVNVGFMGVYIWAFELFPTVIRSQGCNLCACIEKIGAMLVPILTNALQSVNPVLPYAIISVTVVLSSLIALVLPETNKLPTREGMED